MDVEKWFKQTHYVRYSKKTDTVMYHYLTSEKSKHTVFANFMC